MRERVLQITVLIVGCGWLSGGCAAPAKQTEVVDEDPISREASIELFQQRCDQSMLQAAGARWDEGDVNGCRLMLERQLQRRPNHLEARFMLADVYVSLGNVPDAEHQLRWIIQQNPYNPRAHHSLGLLLDSNGRRDEALVHFREAARLEPQNEMYLASVRAIGR